MSRLFNEQELRYYNPKFAKVVGLEVSVAVQRIYGLMSLKPDLVKKNPEFYSGHFYEGQWWVYNTYDEWQESEFEFWSKSTVIRILNKAEELGLIKTRAKLNDAGERVSTWYTVNAEQCEAITKVNKPVAKRKSRWDTKPTPEPAPKPPDQTPDVNLTSGGGSSQVDKYPDVNLTIGSGGGSSQVDYLTVESSVESTVNTLIRAQRVDGSQAAYFQNTPLEMAKWVTPEQGCNAKRRLWEVWLMSKIITTLQAHWEAEKSKHPNMVAAIIQSMQDAGKWRVDSMTSDNYAEAGAMAKALLGLPVPLTPVEAADYMHYLVRLAEVQEWKSWKLYHQAGRVSDWRNTPNWCETLKPRVPFQRKPAQSESPVSYHKPIDFEALEGERYDDGVVLPPGVLSLNPDVDKMLKDLIALQGGQP